MEQEELQRYRERFNEISSGHEPVRTTRLTTLMEDLQQVYGIPTMYSAAYSSNYPEIMRLYKDVSYARKF